MKHAESTRTWKKLTSFGSRQRLRRETSLLSSHGRLVELKPSDLDRLTGNFAAERFLDSGRFHETFLGWDRSSKGEKGQETPVAVKRLTPGARELPKAQELAAEEFSVLSRLSHRNILRLLAFSGSGPNLALVFEHPPGITLHDYFSKSAEDRPHWDLRERVRIALGLAGALSYVHSQGAIHRNVKPAAVLVTSAAASGGGSFHEHTEHTAAAAQSPGTSHHGRTPGSGSAPEAKLQGFHLHLAVKDAPEDPEDMEPVAAHVGGTKGYIAPEHDAAASRTTFVHFRTDTYAFGVILLQLLSGKGCFVRADGREGSVGSGASVGASGSSRHVADWALELAHAGRWQEIADPLLVDSLVHGTVLALSQDPGPGGGSPRASFPSPGALPSTGTAFRACVALALRCCSREPKARPRMSHAADVLRQISKGVVPPIPLPPLHAHAQTHTNTTILQLDSSLQASLCTSTCTLAEADTEVMLARWGMLPDAPNPGKSSVPGQPSQEFLPGPEARFGAGDACSSSNSTSSSDATSAQRFTDARPPGSVGGHGQGLGPAELAALRGPSRIAEEDEEEGRDVWATAQWELAGSASLGGKREPGYNRREPATPDVGLSACRHFSTEQLREATAGFSARLGKGAYGEVFLADLHGTLVAVKRLFADVTVDQSYNTEVAVLSRIRHPNVVLLMGHCPEARSLVYEFLEGGNLRQRLLRKAMPRWSRDGGRWKSVAPAEPPPPLTWKERVSIGVDFVAGLQFLHCHEPPVVHRDLKPDNILLDRHGVCKIGDVGMARFVPDIDQKTRNCAGTGGYIDPLHFLSGRLRKSSDVYSFGLVMLQLLTGLASVSEIHDMLESTYSGDMRRKSSEDSRVNLFISRLDRSAGNWPLDIARELVRSFMMCTSRSEELRPKLSDIRTLLDTASRIP